jgi:RNA polymerase sigma factor (sigma-70 family)
MTDGAQDEQDRRDMESLLAGHEAALNNLMERHGQRLFHYLLRLLSNESDAEDCAQEAFVRVFLNRGKFRADAKFSTWLYAIATNLARDLLRRRVRHPEVSLGLDNDDPEGDGLDAMPDNGPLPGDALQAGERAAQVQTAVAALPEELRTPLVLFEYENFAQAEIAEILRCTPKAVELRIYRARLELRKSLSALSVRNAA